MLHIFHREYAGRPIRVAWTLEELGQPYDVTVMNYEEGIGEAHRGRHPLGRVPVLQSDDGFVFESTAICLHLADSHPDGGLIAPSGTHERALAYQWSCFAPAELEPPLIEAAIFVNSDAERSEKARARFRAAAAAVAKSVEADGYLVGRRFGVSDILVGTALRIPERAGFPEDVSAGLKEYVARLVERPAYERAYERTSAAVPAS